MASIGLPTILAGLAGAQAVDIGRGIVFSDVVIDSRLARPGSLFVALRGEHQDGHDFVADAFGRGATGALVEHPVGEYPTLGEGDSEFSAEPPPLCIVVRDALKGLQRIAAHWRRLHPGCRVVGITGSVGKTTAKELVAAVLAQRYTTLKNPGNLNNELGLPLTLLNLEPDSERAVLEMAMYDLGEIALLAEIARPAVGVVTNVGPTHLERLGTIERIAQAKAELVQALPSEGVAILNGDDPRVRAMGSLTKAGTVLTYGLGSDVDLRATDAVARGFSGVGFDLHYQGENISAQSSLLGLHSVHTAMAAAAVGIAEGLTWPEILSGLADPDARVRLKPLSGRNGSTVLDDTYNASPASSLAALGFLQGLSGRKIAVLGDMLELGSFEEEGHRKVGAAAAEVVSALVTVGSLGRVIGRAASERGMASDAVYTCDDNQTAAAEVKRLLKPGDVVLVKGSRGMAMEEIVAELAEEGES